MEKAASELHVEEAVPPQAEERKLEEDAEDAVLMVSLPRSRHGEKESKVVMKKELKDFKRFKAYKTVPIPRCKKLLNPQWVITEKELEDLAPEKTKSKQDSVLKAIKKKTLRKF